MTPSPPAGDFPGADDQRPRTTFESLFTDHRHFRGDCRLVRTAVRRGWIRPEDRAALVARMQAIMDLWPEGAPETSAEIRGMLTIIHTFVDMQQQNLDAAWRELGWVKRGRPRKRRV